MQVAEFGLSVLLPTQKSHMSNLRLGTPFYMAPETAFKGHVGSASDVFRWIALSAAHGGARLGTGAGV